MPIVTYDDTAGVYEAWLDDGSWVGAYDTHRDAWRAAEAVVAALKQEG